MAHPDTLRSHAKSLHKRALITDKQHERMMKQIAAMPLPANPATAAPDPQMAAGATPAPVAQVPATVSVPGDPAQAGDPTKPQQPPAA